MISKTDIRRVLIVDDSLEDRELYRRTLKKDTDYSYIFIEAETGDEGLESLAREAPDCILLDYNLPDLNGLEFLSEVDMEKNEIPIIMLTGHGNESVAVDAMKSGADDYLIKGAVTQELLSRSISNSIQKKNLTKLLRQKQQELEDFAYIAAHDLKSPLIVVSGISSLLQSEFGSVLGEKGNDFVNRLLRSSSRMTELVDSLLEYARAGRADSAFEEIELANVVQDVMLSLDAVIKNNGARVEVGVLPRVLGDRTGLRQLFQNLISNGIKFSKDKSPIVWVTAGDEGEYWRITVKDNGIGIEQENLEEIFLPLMRLHRKDEFEGSGIGLATCKKVLKQHGWDMTVDSEVGSGTAFHFTVPKI